MHDQPSDEQDPSVSAANGTASEGTSESKGLRRLDRRGREWIDALAGQTSIFGFGYAPTAAAVCETATFLGDAFAAATPKESAHHFGSTVAAEPLLEQIAPFVADDSGLHLEAAKLFCSVDAATDGLITLARKRGDSSRFRTVTLVGSDHGRTGWCRSASGRPELHDDLGPLAVGFDHVPAGDIDALKATVDERTACVLLSPVDWSDGLRPLAADYLQLAAELCQTHDAILAFDETRLCFGSAGQPFSFRAVAEVQADAVMLSGGLFAGLHGGLLLSSSRLMHSSPTNLNHLHLLRRIAQTHLQGLETEALFEAIDERHQAFAVALAETIGGFQFVRDVHVLGSTIGIETDLASAEVIEAAASQQLRLAPSGDHAVCLQLPLVIESADSDELLRRLTACCERLEREPESVSLE